MREVQRYCNDEPTLLELSRQVTKPDLAWSETEIPRELLRNELKNIPDVAEIEVVRHYTRLSNRNFNLDEGMYPLGSCTMKYNPKINEVVASLNGFKNLHPYQPARQSQGALEVLYELQKCLTSATGLDAVTLQGAAGAQGEYVGLRMMMAYHLKNSPDKNRRKVLIPESAHGTNPATTTLCGMEVVTLKANEQGILAADEVRRHMSDEVAGIMLTIPNTLGIFEKEIQEIAKIVHAKDGLVYCDGANLNALLCRVDFKAMGVDMMHINVHKTFSTPHGGGGPGAGPVVCVEKLRPYLPTPAIEKVGDRYEVVERGPQSIGRVKPYFGSFGILLRALVYIMAYGGDGLRAVSDIAVLNANYLREKLKSKFALAFESPTLHEVVFSDKNLKATGVSTMDIAKRLLDFGFHPPTVYFPLIVKGALMIEPTETVSKAELDRFVAALLAIEREANENPEHVKASPHCVGMKRLDEAGAARHPVLTWNQIDERSA